MKSTGENRQLGEKPVPVPLCSPQTPHVLTRDRTPGLRSGRPATNRLSHGMAYGGGYPHVYSLLQPISKLKDMKLLK
jgi:hypothetical protein